MKQVAQERSYRTLLRRLLTISGLAIVSLLALVMSPVILILVGLMSFIPGYTTTPRAAAFFYGYLTHEWAGLARFFWLWLRYREPEQKLEKAREIQTWWAQSLFDMGCWLFRVKVEVSGQEDVLEGGCALLFSRHTSMGDTVLPLLYFGKARNETLRYVIKQELQISPCLDIGGHLLPNVFVDRSGSDSERAVASIKDLVTSANASQSVLIYPEGTRFTQKKHDQLRNKHPKLHDQLGRWPGLLPPRLGGVLGMLEVNPGKDIVFLAHAGFEGSANIHDLLGGGWLDQKIRLHFWRVPFNAIPKDDWQEFMFREWDCMQHKVNQLSAEITA